MLTVSFARQINGEEATPLATIVHRDKSYSIGKAMTEKLKELIPRQLFKIPIQVRTRCTYTCGCWSHTCSRVGKADDLQSRLSHANVFTSDGNRKRAPGAPGDWMAPPFLRLLASPLSSSSLCWCVLCRRASVPR